MDKELYRLASFNSYQQVEGLETRSILTLARKGFFYDTLSSTIVCNLCKKQYLSINDRLCEHEDLVPTTTTSNVEQRSTTFSLQDSTDLSSTLSSIPDSLREVFDACKRRALKVRDVSSGEVTRSNKSIPTADRPLQQSRTTDPKDCVLSPPENATLSQTAETSYDLSTFDIVSTDYSTILLHYEQRLRSFIDTPPRTSGPSVEELAWYGWRYDGTPLVPDRVKCVYCKGNLRDWQDDDDAEIEHRRWYANCKFMKVIRSHPFQGIRRQEQLALNDHMSYYETPSSSLAVNRTFNVEPREIKARMDTTMARTILDMGYTKECVRQVIEERLRTKGDDFPSIVEFMDAVLTKAEEQNAIGPLGASNWKPNLSSTSSLDNVVSTIPNVQAIATNSLANVDDTFIPSGKKRKRTKKRQQAQTASSVIAPNTIVNSLQEPLQSLSISNANTNDSLNVQSNDLNDVEYDSLLVENRTLKDARLCKICMELEVNTVFLPCGHLIACNICSPKVRNCPLCRTFIRGTVKTFLS